MIVVKCVAYLFETGFAHPCFVQDGFVRLILSTDWAVLLNNSRSEMNFCDRRESNPGKLGEKREHHLSDMLFKWHALLLKMNKLVLFLGTSRVDQLDPAPAVAQRGTLHAQDHRRDSRAGRQERAWRLRPGRLQVREGRARADSSAGHRHQGLRQKRRQGRDHHGPGGFPTWNVFFST